MLKEFSQDEIVVLFAHELGHYVHGDHWRKPVVRLGIRLLEYGLIALILAAATATSTGGDITTVPLFVLVNLLSWLYGTITFYRFSRHCEYEADEFALQATGLATAFEQAMIRIANINRVVAHPERESATHPSLVSRIKHAQEFARRNQEMPAENVLQT
jgi:STE24 endopeptidase